MKFYLHLQREERQRAREEAENSDGGIRRVPVVEPATGRILAGLDAPIEMNVELFLAANPGWEVLKLDETDTSEDEKEGTSSLNIRNIPLSILFIFDRKRI